MIKFNLFEVWTPLVERFGIIYSTFPKYNYRRGYSIASATFFTRLLLNS